MTDGMAVVMAVTLVFALAAYLFGRLGVVRLLVTLWWYLS